MLLESILTEALLNWVVEPAVYASRHMGYP